MIERSPAASSLLAAIAQHQDKSAFAELFRAMAPRLRGWFARGGLADHADELTQEVMLRVWRKAGSYDPTRASVDTWVFAIARNARIDHLRRKRPQIDESDPVLVAAEPADPVDALDRARDAAALHDALQTLPETQAAILQAAYFEQKTLTVIATEQGIPLGTVKSRVRLAFTTLRRTLGSGS